MRFRPLLQWVLLTITLIPSNLVQAQLPAGYSEYFELDTRLRGSVNVVLFPQQAVDAGASWRRLGTDEWHESNYLEFPVVAGDHTLEFRDLEGWIAPADIPISVNNRQTTELTAEYRAGGIQVTIFPQRAIDAGALWRLIGADTWRQSGEVEIPLADGVYEVEFSEVAESITPTNRSLSVSSQRIARTSVTYRMLPEAPLYVDYPSQSESGNIPVIWPGVDFAETYMLERSGDGGTFWQTIEHTENYLNYYDDVVPSGDYVYRVAGVNELGQGAWAIGSAACQVRVVAFRNLPDSYMPSVPISARITVTPPDGTSSWALEEIPPPGWQVKTVLNGGTWDGNFVRWGPFFGDTPRELSYETVAPDLDSRLVPFDGSVSFDGRSKKTGGHLRLGPGSSHPADTNVDWRLSVGEITAYGATWRSGRLWPIAPAVIPINYVTNAAFIWRVGEAYVLDRSIPAPSWAPANRAGSSAGYPAPEYHASFLYALATASTAARTISPVDTRSVSVTLAVTPLAGALAYAVEESVPDRLVPAAISEDGAWDSLNRKVKWGPFFDSEPRSLQYTLTGPSGTFEIQGIVSVDGSDHVITGDGQVVLGTGEPAMNVETWAIW